jgi:hypothetical protein
MLDSELLPIPQFAFPLARMVSPSLLIVAGGKHGGEKFVEYFTE